MDSATTNTQSGVTLPRYAMLPGALLRAVEHASSTEASFSDDDGEFFAMAMADSVPAEEVPSNAIMILHLGTPFWITRSLRRVTSSSFRYSTYPNYG